MKQLLEIQWCKWGGNELVKKSFLKQNAGVLLSLPFANIH
jgi:hypothetical protein